MYFVNLPVDNPFIKTGAGVDSLFSRIGPAVDLMVSQYGGRLQETSRLGNMFYAANQAAVTTTVAAATTYTGLCISNPAGGAYNLVIHAAGFKLSVAPAGIATLALMGGYSTAGIVTHTTPLVFGTAFASLNFGSGLAPSALLDSAATIVNPRVCWPLAGGFTAAALPPDGVAHADIGGAITIQPGGWCAIYSLTVVVGFGFFAWTEVPR